MGYHEYGFETHTFRMEIVRSDIDASLLHLEQFTKEEEYVYYQRNGNAAQG